MGDSDAPFYDSVVVLPYLRACIEEYIQLALWDFRESFPKVVGQLQDISLKKERQYPF